MKFYKPSDKIAVAIAVIVLTLGFITYQQSKSKSTPPFPTPTQAMSTKSELTQQEKDQIMTESDVMIKKNSVPNLKYTLTIKKHVGNYVLVQVTPEKSEMVDPSQVVLENKAGKWQAITFGTSFPDLYQKVPELFQ